MKAKNKKVLLITGVLLLLVGVTYAYFTVRSTFNGNGDEVEGVTATVKGSEIIVSGNLEFTDLDILPGHKNISSIKLTATGNAELLPYNLIWNGTNTLNTPLNYTVYKTGEKIETSASCEKKQEALGAGTIYYEECSITNLDKLGTKLSEGTIKPNTTNTKEILVENEFITATSDGATVYYYVILEYPNLDEEQNEDIGGSFSGEVTVEESNAKPDINILAVKIEQEDGTYKDSEDIPQVGYTLNPEKSVCSNGAIPGWDIVNKRFYTDSLTKNGTGCYLYFKKSIASYILKNTIINDETPNFSTVATTNEGIFKAEDDEGTSYYYRGAVENNYVKFANKFWRIIRINGDESIRMIYDGESARANGSKFNSEKSKFNINYTNNMYVGFKYENNQIHGIEIKSNILSQLEIWYDANLLSYASSLDQNAGFCGDRTPSTSSTTINNSGGTGTTNTYYGAYIRLANSGVPTLKCKNESDLYTTSLANKGNKSLEKPIGLITADEVTFAGGYFRISNEKYYLYTGQHYWTISPSMYGNAYVFLVTINGNTDSTDVYQAFGMRPVINLRADVELTGTGTMSDPYVVVGGNS